MNSIFYKLLYFCLFFIVFPVLSQGQGEEMLSRFSASESAGRVDVVWTMRAGNLCLGIDVERTTDTVNGNLETVHRIAGECGDERLDVTYRFADFEPSEGTVNYYRLILGAVPTTFRAVEIPNYGGGDILISPNPAREKTIVRFKNPEREIFHLQVVSLNGELLEGYEGLRGDSFEIQTGTFRAGIYIVRMTSQTKNYSSKLMIIK